MAKKHYDKVHNAYFYGQPNTIKQPQPQAQQVAVER